MKRLRTSVDVLSMSATPIPRTLEMAITGIREMSTIATPPEERHPVLTYVGAYEDRQVTAAIRRELLRDGQVFYIHNRVQSIEKAAAKIKELVPEARVATAHGQMGEHQLEQVMLDFWEKRFDVLVCTTIVESGLDVSNANTMIIERADTLGLSQLHQLRGRVGRSRERAYAYFLYPRGQAADRDRPRAAGHPGPALRPRRRHGDRDEGPRDPRRRQPARRRAVRPHRRRRLRPLRPAGRRGGPGVPHRTAPSVEQPVEVKIELPIDAHLPHDYIPSERLRLEMYKRLAEVRSDEDVALLREELVDRYGEPPDPVDAAAGGGQLPGPVPGPQASPRSTVQGKYVRFHPVELPDSRVVRLNRLLPEEPLQGSRAYDAGAASAAVRVRRAAAPRRGAAGLGRQVIDGVIEPSAGPRAGSEETGS